MPAKKPTGETSERQRRDPNARSVTFRLPIGIHSQLAHYADTERRSMNAVTCLLLEEALEARAIRERKEKQELAELRRLARQAKAAAREEAAAAAAAS